MKYNAKQNKRIQRLIYISDYNMIPPFICGPSIFTYRLLRNFPVDTYIFLTNSFKGKPMNMMENRLWLPDCNVYELNKGLWKLLARLQYISPKLKWLQVFALLVRGMQVVRKESVSHLLVAPLAELGTFLLTTTWLHRMTLLPMSIYFFDMFDRGKRRNWEDRMRSSIERQAVLAATNIFVMSEPLREHYQRKFRIRPILLPHPIDLCNYKLPGSEKKIEDNQSSCPLRIVFTGMIYESQLDAILNMVNVVNHMPNVELHIYSPITDHKRRWMGINGKHVVFHGRVSHQEALAVQQKADILFLPMAFNYVYPHMIQEKKPENLRADLDAGRKVIETASPSKLPEYLAAGRPILIHAPEYSYVAWYGKTHRCAEVVSTNELEELHNAVLRLQKEKGYCDFLVSNAEKAALKHDVKKVSKRLQQCLDII